jgi:hypothetical protein
MMTINKKLQKKSNKVSAKPKIKVSKKFTTTKIPKAPVLKDYSMAMTQKYGKALSDPFNPNTMGIRCPDSYSFPTATYHLRGNTVLKLNANITTLGAAFLPCPLLSQIDLQYDASLYTNPSIGATGMTQCTSSFPVAYGASTPTLLGATLKDYRVVSWGIKIANLQPELTAAGKIYVALVPTSSTIPSPNILGNVSIASGNLTPLVFGTAATTLNSSQIENLPTGQQFVVQDFLHGDVGIAGSYTNPVFFNFKETTAQTGWSSTQSFATEGVITTATGAIASNAGGSIEVNNMSGGVGIIIYGDGLPTSSTSVTNILDIEYIYHLEGTPLPSSTAGTLAAGQGAQACIGSQNIVEMAMSAVSGLKCMSWVEKGAQFLNNARKTVGNVLSSPAGQLAGAFFGL